MRDRTKSLNYSPEKEQFRRDHARRRKWGLARRHAQKLCRSQGCSRECAEVGLHDHAEAVPPLIWPKEANCLQRPSPAAPRRAVQTGNDLPSAENLGACRAAAAARAETAHRAGPATRTEPANASHKRALSCAHNAS